MVFSSAISLFFFVPIVFLLDRRLSNVDAKNTWLLLASLVFYSFGQVYYLPLLLLSVALNYVCGRLAAGKYAKLGVTLAVIGGIGLLAVFKYADFAIRTVNALCGLHLPLTGIALPIGISFFTFQGLSYVIDVYREPQMVSHSFKKVLLYIAFFPQLIAGPIVKYHDVEQEIDSRRTTPQETALGIRRFICGLSKKLLLSNALGQMADTVFALPAGEIGMLTGWTGAICYTLQIYFDFSGYSDMAIGLGRMFGFHFRENFNYPYTATTIKEFWPAGSATICILRSAATERGRRGHGSTVFLYFSQPACGMAQAGRLSSGDCGTACFPCLKTAARFRWTSSRASASDSCTRCSWLCSALRCSVRTRCRRLAPCMPRCSPALVYTGWAQRLSGQNLHLRLH